MADFKVGDKVRIVGGVLEAYAHEQQRKVGDIDVIARIAPNGPGATLYYLGRDGGANDMFYENEIVLVEWAGSEKNKKVTRKQVDKVLRAANKANDIYADPNSSYEDYAEAADDLHKILNKIANG